MIGRRATTLILLLVLVTLSSACAHRRHSQHGCKQGCRAERIQTEQTRELALALFEALNTADVAELDELYADDFTLWTAGSMPISGTSDKAQALAGMKMIDDAFPQGLVFGITAMTVEGDRAAIEAVSNGLHASGKTYHNQYHFLMIARDGRIVALREYLDTMHANDVLMGGGDGR